MRMHQFWAQNGPFAPNFFFFFGGGIINTILIYLLASSIVHNLKKILPVDQELWGYTIFRPKMTHFPNWEWKKKTVNEPNIKVRYYSITEILTIKEYWNLIGREPLLAITWEPDFSQACCFHRMLMNHNNVYLTQISDKTNDVIFLKSSKKFLGHFWPFSRWGFVPKNQTLSHTTIYGPLTPC